MATIRKRASADGTITYQVQIRRKGHPPESCSFARLTDARKWAVTVEAAMVESRHFSQAESSRHTLSEAIARYRKEVLSQRAPSTIRSSLSRLEWWDERLGGFTLDQITPAMIVECREALLHDGPGDERGRRRALRGGGMSPTTVRYYLVILTHLFNLAVREWGWLKESPIRKVTKPAANPGRIRYLTDEELATSLDACRESECGYLLSAVLLALTTGMRYGEQFGLTWSQVDLNRGWITLGLTKNKKRRGVPLVGPALDAIRKLEKVRRVDTDYLFPSHDGKKPYDIRRPFQKALRAANIKDFSWHDLRHCAASYLAMSGVPLKVIGKLLGHSTSAMTDRYSHLADEIVTDAVSKVMTKLFK
ncbi:MAG: tyrosine-type recombinase/integrase [Acidobacteria bacterium]|nr:tyrosine-type recombinase/integrase [Acidobacteriota bacterium]